MGLNVTMEPCDTADWGAGVYEGVKTKTNTIDLPQKSLPTTLKKSLPQTQKAAVREKRAKA